MMTPRDIARRPLFFPLIVLITSIIIWDNVASPPNLDSSLLYTKRQFEGTVVEQPKTKGETTKFAVKLVESPRLVLVTMLGKDFSFKKGARISFLARLKEPFSYKNPGGFDYARYLKRQKIAATAFLTDPLAVKVLVPAREGFFSSTFSEIKKSAKKKISLMASPSAQGVLIALLWGEESLLDTETRELFRDEGLAHLLVISGLHFTAMALVIFWGVVFLFRIYPKSYLFLPVRKMASVATFAILTLYFSFCDSSPSVTRAYIAITCYLAAILLNRPRDWLNILFLAAFIILVIRPSDLFSLSFQFSFVAVLSLLLIYPFLRGFLRKKKKQYWGIEKFKDLIVINISIFVGLTPLLVFYFHQVQWRGLFMNLWAVPVIELAAVPLGLLALSVHIFFPWAASFLFWLDLQFIEMILSLLKFVNSHFSEPGFIFPPRGWELMVYYSLLIILVLEFSRRFKRGVAVMVFLVFFGDALFYLTRDSRAHHLKITHLDVGQGDSLFVELPGGKKLLLDGGGSPYFDIGKNVVIPFLLYKRISQIDVVCLTHAHADHYKGLTAVVDNYGVGEFWWNGIESRDRSFGDFMSHLRKKKIKTAVLASGMKIPLGEESGLEVLAPDAREPADEDPNNQSLVLKLNVKGATALFTGDIELPVEIGLNAKSRRDLKADYLKVAHHGSKTSSGEKFLKNVSPRLASVSAGYKSHFHHPHPLVISRLNNLNIPVFRTDLGGAIEITFEGGKIMVNPFIGSKQTIPPESHL